MALSANITKNPFLQSQGTSQAQSLADYSPETQAELARQERRRQIANYLIQQGLGGGPAGEMVGRFYVPKGWASNVGDLAKVALGAYGNYASDQAGKEAIKREEDLYAEAVQNYKKKIAGVPSQPAQVVTGTSEDENQVTPAVAGRPASPEEIQAANLDLLESRTPALQRMGYNRQAVLDAMNAREDAQRQRMQEQQQAREQRTFEQQQSLTQRKSEQEMRASEAAARLAQERSTKQADLEEKTRTNKELETIRREQIASQEKIAKLNKDATAEKPPTGYRKTTAGLEPIPGGPADAKQQGVLNQDTQTLHSTVSDLDRLEATANQLINHPGLAGITGLRGKVPDVPGTDAANARALLATLKSQIGFSVLQTMRNNSKTGGALGNVSDAEGKRLENNLAAIDEKQSTEQMKKSLQDGIIKYVEDAKKRMYDAYNIKHGEPPSPQRRASDKATRLKFDAQGNPLP